jgi:hypothetical protein
MALPSRTQQIGWLVVLTALVAWTLAKLLGGA